MTALFVETLSFAFFQKTLFQFFSSWSFFMWLYYLSDSLNPELTSFKPALVQGKTAEGLSLPMGWYALVNRRSTKNPGR